MKLNLRARCAVVSGMGLLVSLGFLSGCGLQYKRISGTPSETCYCEKDEDDETYTIDCYFVNPVGAITKVTISSTQYTDPDCSHSVGTMGQTDPRSNAVSAPVSFVNGTTPQAQATSQVRRLTAQVTPAPVYPVTQYGHAPPLPFLPQFSDSSLNQIQPGCDPNISYYKVNHTLGSVTHVAACPLAPISVIPVVSNPLQLALTPDATTLLVTSYDNAINFIDTATDKVTFTLGTSGFPSGIAISPDGARAYVTNYFDIGASLMIVDVPNRKILSQIPMPLYYPKHVYLTPDGSQAWVNFYGNSEIVIVDTLTDSVAYTLNTSGTASTGMAFNSTGTRAYVAVSPGAVTVYNTATLQAVANIPVGPQPVDVVVPPTGAPIMVDSYDSNGVITVIDPISNQVLSSATSGGPASCMAWLPVAP